MDKNFDVFSDAFLGEAMDNEDKRYRDMISANIVPLETATVNDCVQFGKIIWKVIGIENGNKLLLSRDCMVTDFDWEFGQDDDDAIDNNTSLADILSDEESVDYAKEAGEIRKYFREWFCEKYFSQEELRRMVPHCIKIKSSSNDIAQTLNESVFLLSKAEVEKYIQAKEDRIASMHVMFNDVVRDWLLRLDDEPEEYQMVVNTEGDFEKVDVGCLCSWFRPAIWVK